MPVVFQSFDLPHPSFRNIVSFRKEPEVVLSPNNVKWINEDQGEIIQNLVDENSREIFGDFNLDRLLSHKFLAAGIYDNSKLVGAIVANIFPNVPAVNPADWISWTQNQFELHGIDSYNTLWIHLLAWDRNYRQFFLKPLMQFLFRQVNSLEYCIMVVPPGKFKKDFLGDLGSIVKPKGITNEKRYQYLYVIGKQTFSKSYKFRRAVVEDNDDLVPLIEMRCPEMSEIYGEYYIAEILNRSEDRQILVAEYEGTAVAVLCLNKTVNYQDLQDNFELGLFNGLKKPHPNDRCVPIISHHSQHSVPSTQELETIEDTPSGGTVKSLEVFQEVTRSPSSDFSIIFTTGSLFIFQDEDEKESKGMEAGQGKIELPAELVDIFDSITYRKLSKKDYEDVEDDKNTIISSMYSMIKEPLYYGGPNAFALELAACQPEHQHVMSDLLATAFQCFPDRSYCLMTVPSTEEIHKTDSFKNFVAITAKPGGTYSHELYTLHKSSLFGNFIVKEAKEEHYEEIKQILKDIPNHQRMLQMVLDNRNNEISSYVMLCDEKLIGVAVLTREYNLEYLKAFYDLYSILNLDYHAYEEHGIIEFCVVSPIFRQHNKFFLAELLRISDYSVLYYKLSPSEISISLSNRPLMNFLQEMIHVMPRRLPEYDFDTLEKDEWAPPDLIKHPQDAFALYVTSMQFCNVPKRQINTRIVIVGWSALVLSFLQALLFKQDPNATVTFRNITVVAPSVQLSPSTEEFVREHFFIKKHFYDIDYLHKLALNTYVNVVSGKIAKIDRTEQIVIFKNDTVIQYDLLFLMSGEMFLMPEISHNGQLSREKPDNVFEINLTYDMQNAMLKLKQYRTQCVSSEFDIIIYGHSLQSYSVINGLLTYGIKGKHIILVENFPYIMAAEKRHRDNVSFFNHPNVENAARRALTEAGVTIYSSFYFIDWVFDPHQNIITSAIFESRHRMLELKCTVMFFLHDKQISSRIYNVLNDANLVYDGRLVIDADCQTNDPKIYAAGTLTKYSRKYYCGSLAHKHFNRLEIGNCLGTQIRKMLTYKIKLHIPYKRTGWNFYTQQGSSLLPIYSKPLTRYCKLPGGLNYLSVTKPGKRIPLEAAVNDDHYGRVLITGSCENLDKQGFFRIHFNEQRRVETITCLSKFPIDIQNICHLWGKHDQILNNINMRFDMLLIHDLYDYFREPWAYAIYHDKFNELLDDLNYIMTSKMGAEEGNAIIDKVVMEFKSVRWHNLSDDTEEYLQEEFKKLPYEKVIQEKVINFLRDNITHLPMYAHPIIIQRILYNYQESPMFT